ncbi:MAG: hypothetical protein WEC36_09520, partial [Phycisphaeraceae bacterium]
KDAAPPGVADGEKDFPEIRAAYSQFCPTDIAQSCLDRYNVMPGMKLQESDAKRMNVTLTSGTDIYIH